MLLFLYFYYNYYYYILKHKTQLLNILNQMFMWNVIDVSFIEKQCTNSSSKNNSALRPCFDISQWSSTLSLLLTSGR